MSIEVYTGNPGSGKTTFLARQALKRLKINKSVFEQTGYKKTVRSNIYFHNDIKDTFGDFVQYFQDLEDIDKLRDCDLFIDEISLYFDSHNWEALPRRTKKFLRLHRHYGVNIFGASQDFKAVDNSFRRLVDKGNLYYFDRVTASGEPNPAKPDSLAPYLYTVRRIVKATSYDDEKVDYRFLGWGKHLLFTKRDFNIFDTHQEFDLGAVNVTTAGYPDLKKIIQVCPEDGYTKVSYK